MFEFELNDKLIVEQRKVLEQALSTNPKAQKALQKLIQQVLKDAREQVVAATKGALDSDPRGAAQSIRRVVYKKLLGANLNILNMRRRAGQPTNYEPPRKLDLNPHQRGGNRRPRSQRTLQVESYEGVDRGFILRFLNAGTAERETRFGGRGALRARHWFGRSSAFQLDAAATRVAEEIEALLQQEFQMM